MGIIDKLYLLLEEDAKATEKVRLKMIEEHYKAEANKNKTEIHLHNHSGPEFHKHTNVIKDKKLVNECNYKEIE